MKSLNILMLLAVAGWLSEARAQLEIANKSASQCIFSGAAKNISVTLRNPGSEIFANEVRVRLFQTSSSTAVQLGDVTWKKIQVLPRQTVLELAQLDFPAVKAETKFLVQWLE